MNEFGIVHLKDEKFNPAQSRDMQLLIKIAPKRISYAIINERESRLQLLYDSPISNSVEDTLNELIVENDYLRSPFGSVKVSVQTSNFTLIPIQYYTRDDLPSYEKMIQASGESKTFISTIYNDSVNCITALDLQTTTAFTSFFPDARFLSQAEPLVEGGSKVEESATQMLLLQFNEESFEANLSSDDKLIFYNLFNIENADDFNYFLLNIMQQFFSVDAQNTLVVLAGTISAGDANYRRIEKYFKDIRFTDASKLTLFSTTFEQLPKHQHFSLISLLLCE